MIAENTFYYRKWW